MILKNEYVIKINFGSIQNSNPFSQFFLILARIDPFFNIRNTEYVATMTNGWTPKLSDPFLNLNNYIKIIDSSNIWSLVCGSIFESIF